MKKGLFSKAMVALLILYQMAFNFAVLFVFNNVAAEPVTLIAINSSFVLGELALMRGIKKDKQKAKDKKERMDYCENKNRLGK